MNKLYCGDCVDVMSSMESEIIDLTVTSPPYDNLRTYNGYTFDFENIAKQLFRITKDGGVVVWVVGDQTKDGDESGTSFRQALYFKEIGFKLFDTMIYQKPRRPLGNYYYQTFEYMFIFTKGKIKTTNLIHDEKNLSYGKKVTKTLKQNGERYKSNGTRTVGETHARRGNVWYYATGGSTTKDKIAFQHPAIFPEKLAEDHILSWTNPNDLVFDPMCGSGTTGKMALKHNRKFIGVDISEEYIEIARQRLNSLQKRFL